MADSGITKKALASSLKELMTRMPLSKISIGDICENCQMNRKSFYYHFKDKNDLINWIFDTEFLACVDVSDVENRQNALESLFKYLYENKSFYSKVLSVKDQNCFSEHFKGLVEPFVRLSVTGAINESVAFFYVDFVTDAAVIAIEKWLKRADSVSDTEFLNQLRECIYLAALRITEEASEDRENK